MPTHAPNTSASKPFLMTRHDGVGFTTPEPHPRHVNVILSPMLQEGLGDFAVGLTEVPAGVTGARHSHPHTAEVWMFIEGRGRAVIGGEEFCTAPGCVVYTPPGVEHQFINDSDAPVRLYFLYSPSGAEKRIIEKHFR